MAGRRPPKKYKIILLLMEGETSPTIIAKRVGCSPHYVSVMKQEFLRSQKA